MVEITPRGRADVAELVAAAMGWAGLSGPRAASSGRVSRATLERVKRAEAVSEAMLRSVGEVLGLPRDFLLYVGRRDLDAVVRAAGRDYDLMRWTAELMLSGDSPGDGADPRRVSQHTRAALREMGLA